MMKPDSTYRLFTFDPPDEPDGQSATTMERYITDSVPTVRGENLTQGDLRRLWRKMRRWGYDDVSILIEREGYYESLTAIEPQPTQTDFLAEA